MAKQREASPTTGAAHDPSVWGIFTRLLHQLDAAAKARDQIADALEAIRQATGADAVCWFDERTGETLGVPAAEASPSPERRRAVLQALLAKHPDDKKPLLWRNTRPAPEGSEGSESAPQSAAAVHLQPSRPGWIFALSFRARRRFDANDLNLIGLAGAMLLKQGQHSRGHATLKESLLGLVHCLAAVIDAKDACTAGHSERVSRIAVRIGRQMGLSGPVISDLHLSGLMHDVGKIGVPDEVLLKPGKLTAEEQARIREHVLIGDRIVSTIKQFARLRPGVRSHHERWDGQGYPDGLAGENVPLLGRVLAVADSCDAMMSARRYRGAMSPPQIDAILLKHAGAQWDPNVVQHFMGCRQDIYPPIYQKGIGESAFHAIDDLMQGLKDGSSTFYRLADGQAPEDPSQ